MLIPRQIGLVYFYKLTVSKKINNIDFIYVFLVWHIICTDILKFLKQAYAKDKK